MNTFAASEVTGEADTLFHVISTDSTLLDIERQKSRDLVDDMLDICSKNINVDEQPTPQPELYTETNDDVTDSQLVGLCSGSFVTQAPLPVGLFFTFNLFGFLNNYFRQEIDNVSVHSEIEDPNIRLAFDSSDEDNEHYDIENITNKKRLKKKTKALSGEHYFLYRLELKVNKFF